MLNDTLLLLADLGQIQRVQPLLGALDVLELGVGVLDEWITVASMDLDACLGEYRVDRLIELPFQLVELVDTDRLIPPRHLVGCADLGIGEWMLWRETGRLFRVVVPDLPRERMIGKRCTDAVRPECDVW